MMQVGSRLFAGLMLIVVVGCSSSSNEVNLMGRVVLDGRPVPAGFIIFDPDLKSGNDGLQGYAEIVNGVYDTSKSRKGITGGKYIARVNGFEPPQGGQGPQVLFRDFQQPIEVSGDGTAHNIEVPAEARVKPGEKPTPIT